MCVPVHIAPSTLWQTQRIRLKLEFKHFVLVYAGCGTIFILFAPARAYTLVHTLMELNGSFRAFAIPFLLVGGELGECSGFNAHSIKCARRFQWSTMCSKN